MSGNESKPAIKGCGNRAVVEQGQNPEGGEAKLGGGLTPFETFIASGRAVESLAEHVPDMMEGQPGIIYDQGLYIEKHESGNFYLALGNTEFADVPPVNRRRLEAILYQWAISEQILEDSSAEQAVAARAAEAIALFSMYQARVRATQCNLQELTPGVCHVQDIADAWPILNEGAGGKADLDVAYELMCGLLALG